MLETNYKDFINHRKDQLLNRGYDWRGKILKVSISPHMFSNLSRTLSLLQIERLLDYILDSVKIIKKTNFWIYGKSYRDFN